MLNLIIGIVIGAIGVLLWNRFNPNAVDKFIAKHETDIRQRLGIK